MEAVTSTGQHIHPYYLNGERGFHVKRRKRLEDGTECFEISENEKVVERHIVVA